MTDKLKYISIAVLASMLATTVVGEPMKMKVNADNVNIRAGADSNKEVIAQASYDDILYTAGKDESGKWYRILPPQGTKLYVHKEFIKDNKVLVKKLNVRSGPGINYTTITAIPRGQSVNVIEQRNDWLAITPPENSYLWISVDYLEPVVVAKPAPVKKEPVVAKKTPAPIKTVKPPPPVNRSFAGQINPGQTTSGTSYKSEIQPTRASKIPSAIASKKLQSRPQGVYMKGYEGVLKKGSMFVSSPSRYYLMQYDPNDRVIKTCYVLGNSEQLENLLGKSLVISGECYWLDGYSTPVVIPKQITKSK
ncbi:MAG: SH3 domain-containing protein [Kiritimatiellae bacterium]|nr:SH3 domain-containing protein [Kiritimatiellia bacterium]